MKCLALSLCLLVSLFAATPAVTINGTVTDIKGKALAGVGVSLALSGSKTTTDASGAWSLDWPTAGVSGHTEILSAPRWSGKAVELKLASVSEVTVDAFTLSGALLRRTKVGHLEAGYHSIPLPAPSAGLTWLRVTVNGHSESLLAGMGRSAGGRTSGIGAGRAMAFPDTLVFTWKSKVTARRLLTVIPSAAITVVVDTGEIPWQTGITYGSVSDSVGRIYRTVQIGDQTWMAENLNYKGVGKDTIGACFYDSTQYCQIYGRLYSWAEVMRISKKYETSLWGGSDVRHQGICPMGWHVPSDTEWTILVSTVKKDERVDSDSGTLALMSIAGSFTGRDITPGRDLFGFKVLAGGGRYSDGAFLHFGESAPFWSATEYDAVWSWERDLNYVDGTNQGRNYYFSFKPYGYSLRCIQD